MGLTPTQDWLELLVKELNANGKTAQIFDEGHCYKHNELCLGRIQITTSNNSLRTKLEEKTKEFAEQFGLKFIAVGFAHDEEGFGQGDSYDPADYQTYKHYMNVGSFPKYLWDARLHFYTPENFEKYKQLAKMDA